MSAVSVLTASPPKVQPRYDLDLDASYAKVRNQRLSAFPLCVCVCVPDDHTHTQQVTRGHFVGSGEIFSDCCCCSDLCR